MLLRVGCVPPPLGDHRSLRTRRPGPALRLRLLPLFSPGTRLRWHLVPLSCPQGTGLLPHNATDMLPRLPSKHHHGVQTLAPPTTSCT